MAQPRPAVKVKGPGNAGRIVGGPSSSEPIEPTFRTPNSRQSSTGSLNASSLNIIGNSGSVSGSTSGNANMNPPPSASPSSITAPFLNELELRRRRSSSASSSSAVANSARNSIYQSRKEPLNMDPSSIHPGVTGIPPVIQRLPNASNLEPFDAFEREQEAIVNRLQREISQLKTDNRGRSQSRSSSSSLSRNPSVISTYSVSDTEEFHVVGLSPYISHHKRPSRSSFGATSAVPMEDANIVFNLRQENEALKKKNAELRSKLEEKEKELEQVRNQ